MKKELFQLVGCLLIACLFFQCNGERKQIPAETEVLAVEPDYNDSTQWHISDRHHAADVFYIISTEIGDTMMPDNTVYHHADTYADWARTPMYSEMIGVDTLISGPLNFYTPYYRQCSLQSFMNDSTLEARFPVAVSDVKKAFDYFLKNLNDGRPFVLAGFSQGAMIMLELLKEMDATTYHRMIAAYALGTNITKETLAQTNYFVPASGESDTGVTICYNSVRDVNAVIHGLGDNNEISINPVNWKVDDTPAVLITEPTPLLPIDQQEKDTMTVRLDPNTHLLLVDGYTATDYILPLIGKEGNYHSREIWLYRDQLRENIFRRTVCFLQPGE